MADVGRRGFLGGLGGLLGFAAIPIIKPTITPIVPISAIDFDEYQRLLLEYNEFVVKVTGELDPERGKLSSMIEGMIFKKHEAESKVRQYYGMNS